MTESADVPGVVAIVGSGLIGRGWAVVFARAGSEVRLWDAAPAAAEAALQAARQSLDDLAEVGLVADASAAAARLSVVHSLDAALDGAAYAQESVPEKAEVKREVFLALDRAAPPDAILASSASALPGSSFLADVPGRHRCIVAHPANPPHLMPVVEIVPAPWNDAALVARLRALLAAVGQVPVVVHHEVSGFVMNRLQAAVVNEAMALVGRGCIAPDDLDAVMKHSLGLRWSFMGPFETMDLNAPAGFADYAARYGATYQTMGADLTVAAPWREEAAAAISASRRRALPEAKIGNAMRARDRMLMRLLALRKAEGRDR